MPTEMIDILDRGGLVAVLTWLVWALATKRLVPGESLQQAEKRSDRLLELLLQSLGHGDRALEITRKSLIGRSEDS